MRLFANGNDGVKQGCGGGEMALWLRVAAHVKNPILVPRIHTGRGLQHLYLKLQGVRYPPVTSWDTSTHVHIPHIDIDTLGHTHVHTCVHIYTHFIHLFIFQSDVKIRLEVIKQL